jgi:hypothetical protein
VHFLKQSDFAVMIALQLVLILLAVIGISKGIYAGLHPGASLTVGRGELSLTWLYTAYLGATVACGLAIQVAETGSLIGHKVALVALDYILITYLFLHCDWFINSVLYRFFQHVQQI